MARDAAARLAVEWMMGVRRGLRFVFELAVAARAHQIWLIPELQRSQVRRLVVSMRIMASAARGLSLPKALRTLQRLDHKSCLA